MHKKKNSASVLAGELILTFYKSKQAPLNGSRPTARRAASETVLSQVFRSDAQEEEFRQRSSRGVDTNVLQIEASTFERLAPNSTARSIGNCTVQGLPI